MKLIIIFSLFVGLSLSLVAQESHLFKTELFTKVIADGQLSITIEQSDSCFFIIESDDFNPDKFSYSITNQSLSFDPKGLQNAALEIRVGAPNFVSLKISGAGELKTAGKVSGDKLFVKISGASDAKMDLDYQQLSAQLSGASDIKLSGRVDSLYLFLSGASDFDGFGITNTYASAVISGASEAKLNTDSMIVADISGSSSLNYKKNPKYKKINSNESVWSSKQYDEMSVNENGDTITMVTKNNKAKIVIIEEGDDVEIDSDCVDGDNFFKGNWAGLELGVNGYLTPNYSLDMPIGYEFMELKYEKSMNFNINFFQQSFNLIGENFGVVTGLGVHWNNYHIQNNIVLTSDSSTIYGYADNASDRSYKLSKLTAMYVVVPLILEFQTNPNHDVNSFHISAGVVGGVRVSSHSKQVYYGEGNGKHKPKVFDDFYLQPFKLDATARIGWGPLNIYANYSLIEMFRTGRGPELYPFSIGLVLPFSE
jgi:hypothetical protein